MARNRTLLQNGCVITVDKELGNFRRADVLIEGTTIAAIGPDLGVTDADIIDVSNMIVLPGFIDSHRHLWEGILRNLSADGTVADYFPEVMGLLAPSFRPQDAYAGNLIGALGAIDTGITTLLDWSHIQNSPEHADATIQALQDSGMRAIFAYGPPSTSLDWYVESRLPHPLRDVERLRTQYFSSDDQLLTLALGLRGPQFTTMEIVRKDWAWARELGLPITAHFGIGENGFKGGIKQMYEAGLLGPDMTYIHCSTVSDEELQYVLDTGGTFSISATAEMQMGQGMPPVDRILRLGGRLSLSVDIETNLPGDMFTQMRSAFQCQRALVNQRALYGGSFEGEKLVTTQEVLEFVTIEGARTVGLAHKTGSLTPGKEADILLLNADRLNVFPLNDPVGAVVAGADTGNIDSVFIAGRAVKRHGQFVDVNLDRARRLATEARDYVVAKAGLTLPAL